MDLYRLTEKEFIMSIYDIYIPPATHRQSSEYYFKWKIGNNPETEAERLEFGLSRDTPTHRWLLSGITGRTDEQNYYSFSFRIPYINEDPIDRTYTLANGLLFSHAHSIPPVDGWDGVRVIQAEWAEVHIKLDPRAGTTEGTFSARFIADGLPLEPEGSFNMIRDDVPNQL